MTLLNFSPVDEDQDLLTLVADKPLMAEVFRAACVAEANLYDGWINPNHVNARCRKAFADAGDEFDSRSYSAQWAGARGPHGFLDITDVPVPIDGAVSKGNANKALFWHTLRTLEAARVEAAAVSGQASGGAR